MAKTFDATELHISKEQIIQIMDAVNARWKKNRKANAKYIMGLTAFKLGLQFTPDEVVKVIWTDLVILTNEIIAYNEAQRLKGEFPKTADFIKLLERRIESGDMFK